MHNGLRVELVASHASPYIIHSVATTGWLKLLTVLICPFSPSTPHSAVLEAPALAHQELHCSYAEFPSLLFLELPPFSKISNRLRSRSIPHTRLRKQPQRSEYRSSCTRPWSHRPR
jgi:hypothetical protein